MEKNLIVNIDNSRLKCEELLNSVYLLDFKTDSEQIEKTLLKICRISENIYRKTYLTKDSQALIKYYLEMISFYTKNNNSEFVQRWHQKLVGILQESCQTKFNLSEYRLLMQWYIKTLELMLNNKDFPNLLKMSYKMYQNAQILYKKSKTSEDLKFYIFAILMLGTGNKNLNHQIYAYHYYYRASKIMEKLFEETFDVGVQNDLINIYESLYEITNHHIFKGLAKRWKMKINYIKENY